MSTSVSVSDLLDSIATTGHTFLHTDPSARSSLLANARSLIAALETPAETVLWLSWAEPTRLAAIHTALRLNLFSLLTRPCTTASLASSTAASPALLQRLLRHLAATGIIAETEPETWAATPLSQALCDPRHAAALKYSAALPAPVCARLPDFLALTNHMEPEDPLRGPFQHAMDTQLSPWAWSRKQPGLTEAFSLHMSGYHAGRASWMDEGSYPIKDRLAIGCREGGEEVFMVDVGGGLGHDLEELRAKCPELVKGKRMVLQDLKTPVRYAKKARPWIEAMAHDFFQEQPIKGARAYYLHSVLHDWQDEQCRQILDNLRNAMKRGYSKILINENIVPDMGASWQVTSLDIIMMATTGSRERTESQWRELITSAGLQITGIWTKDRLYESLIEAVLPESAKL